MAFKGGVCSLSKVAIRPLAMKSGSKNFLAPDLLHVVNALVLHIDIATFFIASKVFLYEDPYGFAAKL
jgi:hypothetical protein